MNLLHPSVRPESLLILFFLACHLHLIFIILDFISLIPIHFLSLFLLVFLACGFVIVCGVIVVRRFLQGSQ
jgi:hypothetical protein